ncbi:MAG: SDR family oxidoreductase [Nostoc sp.]|uniref:type I polyketide synthase n=1 Tax=Nostoc sp. TaxID=1180 RepID=UPI002FF760FA
MKSEQNGLEVAIIGLAGRFPGSKNIEEFWQNLSQGIEFSSVLQDSKTTDPDVESAAANQSIKAAALLENIEEFDAAFFGFNPREAEIMDPQQRLFLECAWEALENAGYDSEREERSIGVYAGVGTSTYLLYNLFPNNLKQSMGYFPILLASDKDYAPTRVSYKLNLKGPSVCVGTACSSSLVAAHFAYQSLLSGECDMALAAGVSIKAPQTVETLCPEGIAADGHCRAFDAQAQGTIGGNGVGVVVLKRLEDAIADQDYIYGVIKGSAINNDGAVKVSYTAPSQDAQARVIRAAQVMAEVEPETISYIEAHGTGTPMGDPIEIAALTQAFATDKKGYCAIGSVKTNIGHLDAAAGIAGLIKTILALDRQTIPASLNFATPNPQIDFANSPFYVNHQLAEWKTDSLPRRAGVSSFGFGGTNAHIILEEAPPVATSAPSRPWQLLMVSTKTNSALKTTTANLVQYLQQHSQLNLADVAYTLQIGRREFEHRQIVVCQDVEDAIVALKDTKRVLTSVATTSDRPVAFMFTGLGTQYVNMTEELYQLEPTFQKTVAQCCEILKPLLNLDLRDVIYPKNSSQPNLNGASQPGFDLRKMLGRTVEQPDAAAEKLNQTYLTQPAIFVIEYALAQLWISWGIRPVAMIGYSIGEYVAATLAGVLSLEDALTLVAKRAQMIQELPNGAMLAVPLSESEVRPFLNEKLSLSAINGAKLCVVAGDVDAIDELAGLLTEKGLACRRLQTSHAFHSYMMEAIADPFTELVKTVKRQPPQIPYLSNVTGTWITADQATDASYWTKHLCQPVRFGEGVKQLWKKQNPILLEVGAGQTLSSLALQYLESEQVVDKVVLPSLRYSYEQQSDLAFLLNTLGQLWLSGVEIDWSAFYAHERRRRIPLPTYPFERQRYWIDTIKPSEDASQVQQVSSGKKPDIADWFYIPSWKRSMLPPVVLKQQANQQESYLIFIDESNLGEQIAQRLKLEGQNVITVRVGEQFAVDEKQYAYTINPRQPNDYHNLFQELSALNFTPKTIVHLWGVTPLNETILGVDEVDQAQDVGFYSLLFIAQVLDQQNWTKQLQIMLISNNMQYVTGDEILSPQKATVLGACKVIPQEYPNISCRSIDVVLPCGTVDKLVDSLLKEISTPSTNQVIAYRNHHRWVQHFEQIQWDVATVTPQLRDGGVYLITGGLGKLGLLFAEYLAKTVKAKLILTGRSVLPNRDDWSNSLLEKVLKLEALGAEVLVVGADSTNHEQMQSAIAQAEARFGKINGVIHAAAITDKVCIIELTTKTECEQQFAAKVHGLLVLAKVLESKELDFCLLMSSLSSVLGGRGLIAYSAANLFMDAFVHQHNQTSSVRWISVNWGIWQVGKNQQKFLSVDASLAEFILTPEEGIDVLERVLSWNELNQVFVSSGNLTTRLEEPTRLKSVKQKANIPEDHISSVRPRPILKNEYIAPTNEIENKIAESFQKFLGFEQVGIYDSFFALGGDSLTASVMINQLRDDFQIKVPLRTLFQAPTVAQLSMVVEKIILEELEELTDEEVESNLEKVG